MIHKQFVPSGSFVGHSSSAKGFQRDGSKDIIDVWLSFRKIALSLLSV